MTKPLSRWVHLSLGAGWLAAIVLAYMNITRPAPLPPLPTGWAVWREIGPVRALALAPDGVYAGGANGLFLLKEDGPSAAIEIPGAGGTLLINAILFDGNGALWVGHDQGLSIRRGSTWKTLTEADGLPHRRVAGIAVTREGFVWLGTPGGAVRIPMDGPEHPTKIKKLATTDGLLDDMVWPIVEDDEGGLWFGNYAAPRGGLNRLQDGQWRYWTLKNGLPHANITCLMPDRAGRIWAGGGLFDRGGAAIFSRSSDEWQLETTIPTNELVGPKVRSLAQDSKGRIWLGSEYDGLTVRGKKGTLLRLTVNDGLAGQEVMAIIEANDKSIWLGTSGGVNRIGPEALEFLFARSSEDQEGKVDEPQGSRGQVR